MSRARNYKEFLIMMEQAATEAGKKFKSGQAKNNGHLLITVGSATVKFPFDYNFANLTPIRPQLRVLFGADTTQWPPTLRQAVGLRTDISDEAVEGCSVPARKKRTGYDIKRAMEEHSGTRGSFLAFDRHAKGLQLKQPNSSEHLRRLEFA